MITIMSIAVVVAGLKILFEVAAFIVGCVVIWNLFMK